MRAPPLRTCMSISASSSAFRRRCCSSVARARLRPFSCAHAGAGRQIQRAGERALFAGGHTRFVGGHTRSAGGTHASLGGTRAWLEGTCLSAPPHHGRLPANQLKIGYGACLEGRHAAVCAALAFGSSLASGCGARVLLNVGVVAEGVPVCMSVCLPACVCLYPHAPLRASCCPEPHAALDTPFKGAQSTFARECCKI